MRDMHVGTGQYMAAGRACVECLGGRHCCRFRALESTKGIWRMMAVKQQQQNRSFVASTRPPAGGRGNPWQWEAVPACGFFSLGEGLSTWTNLPASNSTPVCALSLWGAKTWPGLTKSRGSSTPATVKSKRRKKIKAGIDLTVVASADVGRAVAWACENNDGDSVTGNVSFSSSTGFCVRLILNLTMTCLWLHRTSAATTSLANHQW